MQDSTGAYTRVAVVLHWIVGPLIFLNFLGGLYMESLEKNSDARNLVLFYHASLGSTIFLLVVLRLLWRVTHQPAPLPASVPRWQVGASHAVHWLLYAVMLAAPLAGYIHRLAGGHPVSWFGLFELPVFLGKDEPLRQSTDNLHILLVWLLAVLAAGHIAAALKHRFIDRDGVAERMLPGGGRRA